MLSVGGPLPSIERNALYFNHQPTVGSISRQHMHDIFIIIIIQTQQDISFHYNPVTDKQTTKGV